MKTIKCDILLVEDNENDAELTLRSLKSAKLSNNIQWVQDGEQALDLLFSEGEYKGKEPYLPKIILLDLRMPKLDGLEVLKLIRSNKTTETIPVVIMTSSAEEQDIIKSYKLGANSYVTKPINFTDFTKVVTDLGFYWLFINKGIYA